MRDNPCWLERRARAFKKIRGFFESRGYTEVFTSPLLKHPNLDPNIGVFKLEGEELYLHTSPEYPMKKLLARERRGIYQLAPVFRRDHQDHVHRKSFLMLEWYCPDKEYTHLMEEAEGLVSALAEELGGGPGMKRKRLGNTIDLTPPWPRITVEEAVKEWAGIEIEEMRDQKRLQEVFEQKGLNPPLGDPWETWFNMLFVHCVEPRLREMERPVFLYDYPVEVGLMAAPHPHNSTLVQRVELFAGDLELLNGYTELTDPGEQVRRWSGEGKSVMEKVDNKLLHALPKLGLVAGAALGVERLLMLLWEAEDIAQVSLSE